MLAYCIMALFAAIVGLVALLMSGSIWIGLVFMVVGAVTYDFFFYLLFLRTTQKRNIQELENTIARFRDLSYRPYLLSMTCPACKKDSDVIVNLEDTEYQCPHCKTNNAVYVNFTVVQKTNPLALNINASNVSNSPGL
jgi:hypothetical protein